MTDAQQSPSPHVTPEFFRGALRRFPTGVTVVTTIVDSEPHGMTANAFASASLAPPLVLVCVDRQAQLHAYLEEATAFGVSILAADQQELFVWFATPERPPGAGQFAGISWFRGTGTGAPLLDGAAARLECRRAERFPAGDHSIYTGQVVAADFDTSIAPLLYVDGDYVVPPPR